MLCGFRIYNSCWEVYKFKGSEVQKLYFVEKAGWYPGVITSQALGV